MEKQRYDMTTFGEILIDFTYLGTSDNNQKLFAQNPGGAPANVMVCASKLGSKTAFLGKAGNDMHGTFLKQTLQDQAVDTTGFLLDDEHFTTLAFVDLNEKGERSFSFARKPGADTQMSFEELDLSLIENSKIFHIGSLSLTHQPARQATLAAIEHARRHHVLISYDPNYRASLWESEQEASVQMQQILPDIMKISDEETHLLTSHHDYALAAQELFDKGVKIVVVTLGKVGCYVHTKQGGAIVGTYDSKVVDTTGAGDSFWGGFLHQIAHAEQALADITLEQAVCFAKFANIVASFCVEGNGAIPSMPTLQQVNSRLHLL